MKINEGSQSIPETSGSGNTIGNKTVIVVVNNSGNGTDLTTAIGETVKNFLA